jgi:hypothetical protein
MRPMLSRLVTAALASLFYAGCSSAGTTPAAQSAEDLSPVPTGVVMEHHGRPDPHHRLRRVAIHRLRGDVQSVPIDNLVLTRGPAARSVIVARS